MSQKRCLIIALTPLETTLEALMALRAATQVYPFLELHLLVQQDQARLIESVPWIESVSSLPRVPRGESEFFDREVKATVRELRQQKWDYLINWTFSEAGSYLNVLIPAKVKFGYSRSSDQKLSACDGWTQFIQGIVLTGVDQNIHLTDILTTQFLTALQIHEGEPKESTHSPLLHKGFFSVRANLSLLEPLTQDPARKWMLVDLTQMPAGWEVVDWAEFATYLLSKHPEYGVLGVGHDAETVDQFRELVQDCIDVDDSRLIGRVVLPGSPEWVTLLSRCTWTVSQNTAQIQLASILGTRVLNLSVHPYRHRIFGPYGNGHYVISPQSTSLESPSSEAVYSVWSYGSQEWSHRRQISLECHIRRLGFWDHFDQLSVARSRIRNSTDGGGVVYEAQLERPHSISDWTAQIYGQIARTWYCGWTPPVAQELERKNLSPELIQRVRKVRDATSVLKKVCNEAQRTAIELQGKSQRLRSDRLMPIETRQEIQNLGKKLAELDQLVIRLAEAEATLSGFAQMSRVMMHNLKGSAISDLSEESAQNYQHLLQGITIFEQWVEATLNLVKPTAVPLEAQNIHESNPNPS
jgi:ADP-heptose:LPS heptosyltransferase